MKRLRFKALLMLIAGLCMSVSVFAQQMTVTGVVKDPTGYRGECYYKGDNERDRYRYRR